MEEPSGRLGGEGLGQGQGRVEVGGDLGVEMIARQGLDAVVEEQRGVVDQQRQRPQRLGRATDQGAGLGVVGQVGLQRYRLAAPGADLGGDGLSLLGRAAIVDRHVEAGVRQGQGQGPADTLAGAGHQGCAAHPPTFRKATRNARYMTMPTAGAARGSGLARRARTSSSTAETATATRGARRKDSATAIGCTRAAAPRAPNSTSDTPTSTFSRAWGPSLRRTAETAATISGSAAPRPSAARPITRSRSV